MTTIPDNPTSPNEWLQYAQSEIITAIPLRQSEGEDEEQASYLPS
jgi:hypothetical protein